MVRGGLNIMYSCDFQVQIILSVGRGVVSARWMENEIRSQLLAFDLLPIEELLPELDPYRLSLLFEDFDSAYHLLKCTFGRRFEDETLVQGAEHLVAWREHSMRKLSSLQTLNFARAVKPRLEKPSVVSVQDVYQEQMASSIELVRHVSKSGYRKAAKQPTESRLDLEHLEKERWAATLAAYIKEAELPLCKVAEATSNPTQILLKSFGSRRAKTLRNRARSWAKVRSWLLLVKSRVFPVAVSDMLDYLLYLEQEGLKKSHVHEVAAALAVIEDVGLVGQEQRISAQRVWVQVCQNLQTETEIGNTNRHMAPPFSVAVILSMEISVCDADIPEYHRALIWVVLLCVWACMRISDLEGLDPRRLSMSRLGFKAVLTKTKTTGPGKRVLEVPVFVHRRVTLSGFDWLTAGWSMWDHYSRAFPRDYFLMKPNDSGQSPTNKYMNTAHFASYLRKILRQLPVPVRARFNRQWKLVDGSELVTEDLALFWSGHSMRHFVPTAAAAMGFSKEERDFVGRWHVNLHQSNDYLLSSRQNVHKIQVGVAKGICDGSQTYDESELLSDLEAFVAGRGGDAAEVKRCHVVMKRVDNSWQLGTAWPDDEEFERTDYWAMRHEEQSSDMAPKEGNDGIQKSSYFVVISRRSGFRRLHKINACGLDWRSCSNVELLQHVTNTSADAVCRRCAQIAGIGSAERDDSSTSGSSSSTSSNEIPSPREQGLE